MFIYACENNQDYIIDTDIDNETLVNRFVNFSSGDIPASIDELLQDFYYFVKTFNLREFISKGHSMDDLFQAKLLINEAHDSRLVVGRDIYEPQAWQAEAEERKTLFLYD